MYTGALLGHPLAQQCTRFVTRHKPLTHRQWLRRIEQVPEVDLEVDCYGDGPAMQLLERTMADLLGKEQALFVHKGSVGQYAALLEYARRSRRQHIAIHPQSHFAVDEADAYQALLRLQAVAFGSENEAIRDEDITRLAPHADQLSTVCIELPVRRAGFRLPDWQTLLALQAFAQEAQVPLHIDGARLLESAHYWHKPYDQVADLGDSVYVSLYKMLGAAAGGVIAADAEFISSLRVWRSRLAGDLYTAFPYVLSALWGLKNYLPRVGEFHARAQRLSECFAQRFGDAAIAHPVQSSGFQLTLPIAPQALHTLTLQVAQAQKTWLFDRVYANGQGRSMVEIQVGDALDDWQDDELVDFLFDVIDARSQSPP
ncbi:MAG: beta-eliminating lyase-related protein [Pseudomonadota bacterium]